MHRIHYGPLSILLLLVNVYGFLPAIRVTQNGPIVGMEKISVLNRKYYAFKGVPFAAPPITGIDPYSGEQVDRRFQV